MTLVFPLIAEASLPEKLKDLDNLRLKTALCQTDREERVNLESSLKKVSKRGKKGEFTVAQVLSDYDKSVAGCSKEDLLGRKNLTEDILNFDSSFPISIMEEFTGSHDEHIRDELALQYVKSKEASSCPEISRSDVYKNSIWHETLLHSGWPCTSLNFKRISQEINEEMSYGDAQKRLEELSSMELTDLKKLFRKIYKVGTKDQKIKIAFVPQLSWENGTLNTVIPYRFFTKPTELTSYRYLVKQMKKLGVQATMIERNSLAPLEEQVRVTRNGLLELDGPHMVISRSMGSRVVREIVADNDTEVNGKISSWLNVGGTPHGSVIARAKIHPDNFYRGLIPSVAGAFKLPIGLISKDPRVASHIEDTLLSAIVRENLKTLESSEARHIKESTVPVLNAVFVREDYERATSKVDPVWMHMLQYGPTEGSSLLTGSAVDTANSMRLVVDSDHLAFWKYSPEEALAVFLRLMIVSGEANLERN